MAPRNGHGPSDDQLEQIFGTPPPPAPYAPSERDILSIQEAIKWEGAPIEGRKWLVEGVIPLGVPTLLSGHGGVGKSLIGMQLVHSCATGMPWLGFPTMTCRAIGVMCEDDRDEVHRRAHGINTRKDTPFGDQERLRFLIRDGMENSLMAFDSMFGLGTETEFFQFLCWLGVNWNVKCYVLDSLYNFFSGDQNSQTQVHQFVNMLKRLCKAIDGAVVLLGHPSKSAQASGDGYSGSVVWHDAMRSRLFLTEEETNGEKKLLLKAMKANYGPKAQDTELFYDEGVLEPKITQAETTSIYYKIQVEVAFIKCLREMRSSGRNVTDTTNAVNYAPKVFSRMNGGAAFKKSDLETAMQRLFDDKKIVVQTTRDAYRNQVKGIFEVLNIAQQHDETD